MCGAAPAVYRPHGLHGFPQIYWRVGTYEPYDSTFRRPKLRVIRVPLHVAARKSCPRNPCG